MSLAYRYGQKLADDAFHVHAPPPPHPLEAHIGAFARHLKEQKGTPWYDVPGHLGAHADAKLEVKRVLAEDLVKRRGDQPAPQLPWHQRHGGHPGSLNGLLDEYAAHEAKARNLGNFLGHAAARQAGVQEAQRVLANHLHALKNPAPKLAASNLMYQHLPSVAAAMDAWSSSRAEQQALADFHAQRQFPASYATQPAMRAMAMGDATPYMSFDQAAPTVHHRRHRHHHE